jgi:hypothetical protein
MVTWIIYEGCMTVHNYVQFFQPIVALFILATRNSYRRVQQLIEF